MSPASVFPGGWISTELGNAQAPAELEVALRFWNAVRLARMQADQSLIGRKRGIVGVDRIERKVRGRGKMEDFRAGGFELTAKTVMLRLCDREIRRVQEAQLPPASATAGWSHPAARGVHTSTRCRRSTME